MSLYSSNVDIECQRSVSERRLNKVERLTRSVFRRLSRFVALVMLFLLIPVAQVSAQEVDPQCMPLKSKWEQAYQEIKDRLDKFNALEQTPVEKITNKPLVSAGKGKTIASQVAEGLAEKEEILKSIRKETRNLLGAENKFFSELQQCSQSVKSAKNKDFNNIVKKRKALLDKALVCLTEVREVEGKETVIPYTEASGQDAYRRSVNNQWQNYNRGYWGY